jgi:hypothetical protein
MAVGESLMIDYAKKVTDELWWSLNVPRCGHMDCVVRFPVGFTGAIDWISRRFKADSDLQRLQGHDYVITYFTVPHEIEPLRQEVHSSVTVTLDGVLILRTHMNAFYRNDCGIQTDICITDIVNAMHHAKRIVDFPVTDLDLGMVECQLDFSHMGGGLAQMCLPCASFSDPLFLQRKNEMVTGFFKFSYFVGSSNEQKACQLMSRFFRVIFNVEIGVDFLLSRYKDDSLMDSTGESATRFVVKDRTTDDVTLSPSSKSLIAGYLKKKEQNP